MVVTKSVQVLTKYVFLLDFKIVPALLWVGEGDSRFLYSVFLTMTYGGGETKTVLAALYRHLALLHARVNAFWSALLLIYYNNMNTIIMCKASNSIHLSILTSLVTHLNTIVFTNKPTLPHK